MNVNVRRNHFDPYYYIKSAQTKKIMVHYISQPHHIFMGLQVFVLMLVPGGLQLLILARVLRDARLRA